MSSVTIGRDLQHWQWAQSESGSVARGRRRFVARTSGEVVGGNGPPGPGRRGRCLRARAAAVACGRLRVGRARGLCPAGSVRLAHHAEREQGPGHGGCGGGAAAHRDRRLRRIRSAGAPVRLVGLSTLCLLLIGRAFAYVGIRWARGRGALGQRVLIVGAGQVAERFADALELNPSYGLHPVGLLDDCAEESLSRPVLGGIDQLDSVLRDNQNNMHYLFSNI